MIQDNEEPGNGLPPAMLRVGRVLGPLLNAGVPLGPLWLMDTRGRKTGALRTVPVVVLRCDGQRWLVSVFGETGWVRNLRVAKSAQLRRGRRVEKIEALEVRDKRRAVAAMRLRRSFRLIPFVRDAFAAGPRDGAEAFEAEAGRHPVFLISDADAGPT
jgi:deazaflavin-dependent oxidoreductase (nitroreductase family)